MKTSFTLFFAFLIMAISNGLHAQGTYVSLGNNKKAPVSVVVAESGNGFIRIVSEVSGFETSNVISADGQFQTIEIIGAVSLGNEGEASLPVITKFVQIPNFKDVKIRINRSSYSEFQNMIVQPFQKIPLRSESGKTDAVNKNEIYYGTDKYLPENIVSVKEIAAFRDLRIAVISINPVQYNPAERNLRVYSSIEFDVQFEGYSSVNNPGISVNGISAHFDKLYRQLVLNYEAPSSFLTPPNMLIIADDVLFPGVADFASWKNKKGIRSVVKRESEIAGIPTPTAAQIKDYLIQQYNSPDRPEFVLFVGDAAGSNTIPWFTSTGGKSDHPYQCLEGTDILPDIVVGRVSVQSLPELDSALGKLIQYEKQPNMLQTDWYKRAIVLHSNDGIDPINGQVAQHVFLNEGGFANVSMVNNSFSQSQITGLINQGASWIWFIGHGSETSWADPVWNMSNMVNLNFGYRQPSIVSIACSNADLDYSQTADCFGEAWIERQRGNSASNIAASTELCAFYTTDTIGREMLYAYFRHDINDFGSMLNFGKIKAYQYFNGNGTVVETINQFMVLGDPSQEAFSDIPRSVTLATSYNGNNCILNVKSSGADIKGALVAINQGDSLKFSGYTDRTGNFSFDKTTLNSTIPATAVVTGKNLHPYEGTLLLTDISISSHSPESFQLNQNYPNPFNPSTKIYFSIGRKSHTTLEVYDMLGRKAAVLIDGVIEAGGYNIDFNASELPAGVYVYRLSSDGITRSLKMTLLK